MKNFISKKLVLVIVLCVSAMTAKSQTIINSLSDTGNVGIGTTNPACKFQVVGETRLNGSMVVDSSVTMSDSLKVLGKSLLKDVNIEGNAIIAGDAKISGSLSLGNLSRVSAYTAQNNTTPVVSFSSPTGTNDFDPVEIDVPCTEPLIPAQTLYNFNGRVIAQNMFTAWGYNAANANGPISRLDLGYDGANGIIDLSGNNGTGQLPHLLMNYYCGSDIYMCTGTNGGYVGTGKHFEVGIPTRNPNVTANIKSVNSTGLMITAYGSTSASDNVFDVWDGDANKVNFRVKKNGFVQARELKVHLATFPDYVFAKDYKLMPLEEVKTFVFSNKHLPNVKTEKEIVENGMEVGAMQSTQMEKIEEAYLYIFQLNDELQKTKAENDALKKELEAQKKDIETIKAALLKK